MEISNIKPLYSVHIETWGCQMNVADSERMKALLKKEGFTFTSHFEEAQVIILNTCNVREKARQKVLSRLGEFKEMLREKPETLIVVAGCVAQTEAVEVQRSAPFVDILIGPDHIEKIAELVFHGLEKKKKRLEKLIEKEDVQAHKMLRVSLSQIHNAFDEEHDYSVSQEKAEPWMEDGEKTTKFVNIIKGCNNFCSYCIVPYTRGREKSRHADEILKEVQYYLNSGVKEIVLLGQNVNSWGLDFPEHGYKGVSFDLPTTSSSEFIRLLYAVSREPSLKRLRFVTSNPHDVPEDLPEAFASIPQLMDQLHLPVQSGSNAVLERMNRRYTREHYLNIVEKLKKVRPQISLGTDIIVGFPGETEDDFEQTVDLFEKVKFSYAFCFGYSPRKGTQAASFEDTIPEKIKNQRLNKLIDMNKKEVEKQNLEFIGKTILVMVHYVDPKDLGCFYGRTFCGRLVKIRKASFPLILGSDVHVHIQEANSTALVGELKS